MNISPVQETGHRDELSQKAIQTSRRFKSPDLSTDIHSLEERITGIHELFKYCASQDGVNTHISWTQDHFNTIYDYLKTLFENQDRISKQLQSLLDLQGAKS